MLYFQNYPKKIISFILISIAASFTFHYSFAQEITTSASKELNIIAGASSWFTIAVPADANNPQLVGSYQVANGETIKVDVLKEDGCPTPLSAFDCVSIYSAPESDHGNFEVGLEPGKTYYLLFSNTAFLFPTKSVNVDYQLQTGGT